MYIKLWVNQSNIINYSAKKSRFEEKFNPNDGFMGMAIVSPKKELKEEFFIEKILNIQDLVETNESDTDDQLFLKLVAKSEKRL